MSDWQAVVHIHNKLGPRQRVRGFTLIELLIGIAVGGFVFSLFTNTLVTTFMLFRRGVSLAGMHSDSQTALNQLVKDITSATNTGMDLNGDAGSRSNPGSGLSAGSGDVAFRGRSDYVEFQQTAPRVDADGKETPHEGGVRRIAYRVRYDADGEGTIEKIFLSASDASPLDEPAHVTIARKVHRLTFSYFNGRAWQPRWQSATLPRAVRVTVDFAPLPQGRRPPFVSATIARIPAAP